MLLAYNEMFAIRLITQTRTLSMTERFIVIYGEDDYLRRQAEQEVCAGFNESTSLDVQAHDDIIARLCQRELLQPAAQLYVLRSKDEQLSLWRALLEVRSRVSNVLLFNCRKKSLSASLQKILKKLAAKLSACPTPRPYEYTQHLRRICAQHDLQLDHGGQQLLLEHVGWQLDALVNEVQKLSLIFSTNSITAADIAPHLGLLREDNSFVIIDMLLNKQYSRAQLLVEKLLQRGESALAILGVLAYFLRNLCLAHEGQLKLAPRLTTRYRSLARHSSHDTCLHLLSLCQQADMDLKTSRTQPTLVLANIILSLCLI